MYVSGNDVCAKSESDSIACCVRFVTGCGGTCLRDGIPCSVKRGEHVPVEGAAPTLTHRRCDVPWCPLVWFVCSLCLLQQTHAPYGLRKENGLKCFGGFSGLESNMRRVFISACAVHRPPRLHNITGMDTHVASGDLFLSVASPKVRSW